MGKGIEVAFLKRVFALLKEDGIEAIKAMYIPTAKNGQVRDFYDKIGFTLVGNESSSDGVRHYRMELSSSSLEIEPYYKMEIK